MIVSVNSKPPKSAFAQLMKKTDMLLNKDALARPRYYAGRGGKPLETDVKEALVECSKGTAFENTIEIISGQKFPDIVLAKFYGVEVKSTKENHWTSTGSSILESSRVPDVERIYMTFGKLGGNPIEFLSRPYEECLSGIAVTHMPRYLIDMRLQKGETIFDKMNVPYETLRHMDNPVAPVSRYYRSQLKKGESLWWVGDTNDECVSAKIRTWRNVGSEEKERMKAYACVNFPEVFRGYYDNYALWLTSQGVIDKSIRDQFSSGGKEALRLCDGTVVGFPGIYRRVKDNIDYILHLLNIKQYPAPVVPQSCDNELIYKILLWAQKASDEASKNPRTPVDARQSYSALIRLFSFRIPGLAGLENPDFLNGRN